MDAISQVTWTPPQVLHPLLPPNHATPVCDNTIPKIGPFMDFVSLLLYLFDVSFSEQWLCREHGDKMPSLKLGHFRRGHPQPYLPFPSLPWP